MTTITIDQRITAELESLANLSAIEDLALDYGSELETAGSLLDTMDVSSPTSISASSILWTNGALELELSGSGLSPISTAEE